MKEAHPMRTRRILLCILIIGCQYAHAQYFGERVLEKSFERSDFFFRPHFVNPYGIGDFGSVAPGLIDDLLLNLIVNPASIVTDSITNHYTYLSFRNSRQIEEQNAYPILYDGIRGGISADYAYYPNYYINTRKEIEPVIFGATFFRPFGKKAPRITLGLTYQAIFQDEEYYEIPQDIYQSSIGYDYAGNRMTEDTGLPIVDRYSGKNDFHQEGHFVSLLAGLPVSHRLSLGLRLSRVVFNREGAFGSQNLWEAGSYASGTSIWSYMTGREQDYGHWDLSGGLNARLFESTTIGMTAGILWGDVTQNLFRRDSSDSRYGIIDEGTEWSFYSHSGRTNQFWKHDGQTVYGGINLSTRLSASSTFVFYYRAEREDADITLNSSINDTSYSNYYYESDQWLSGGISSSALKDDRSGTGRRNGWTHRVTAALQWQVEPKMRLHVGINLSRRNCRTETSENVLANRFSDHFWFNGETQNRYYYATEEEKELLWDFKTSETTIQIPVILNYRLSKYGEITFGVNRSMKRWNITDVTLAIFDHRTTTQNEQTTRKEHFGERYTQPEETRSDVKTTLLLGATIIPSKHFNVRLLMAPNFVKTYDETKLHEFQWWIDFNLFH
jgi:hypothetical protein